jgi:hypothetical protein
VILCHKHPDQAASDCPKCDREKFRAALEWIAKGFLHGEPECKTVGYLPPRAEGQHCPSCWLYHAKALAQSALGNSSGKDSTDA